MVTPGGGGDAHTRSLGPGYLPGHHGRWAAVLWDASDGEPVTRPSGHRQPQPTSSTQASSTGAPDRAPRVLLRLRREGAAHPAQRTKASHCPSPRPSPSTSTSACTLSTPSRIASRSPGQCSGRWCRSELRASDDCRAGARLETRCSVCSRKAASGLHLFEGQLDPTCHAGDAHLQR